RCACTSQNCGSCSWEAAARVRRDPTRRWTRAQPSY
ncbi:ORFL214C, partial [Human betaherpesvirus 5]